MYVTATRLQARGLRELREVLALSRQVERQLATAPGFLGGRLLVDRRLTAWTLSTWADRAALQEFGRSHAAVAAQGERLASAMDLTVWAQRSGPPPSWDEVRTRWSAVRPPAAGLHLTLPPSRVRDGAAVG